MFYLMLATLTLPTVALTVPLFSIVGAVGLFDSYFAVILPLSALDRPVQPAARPQLRASLPQEVFEAATWTVAPRGRPSCGSSLPMTRPIAGVIVVWSFLAAWNEYVLALLFLQSPDRHPSPSCPSFFVSQPVSDQPKIVAALGRHRRPDRDLYLCMQRFFERGSPRGAIK